MYEVSTARAEDEKGQQNLVEKHEGKRTLLRLWYALMNWYFEM
jgi:hypothetical protein